VFLGTEKIGEYIVTIFIKLSTMKRKILITLILISVFSVKGQIGVQLTTMMPVSEIKTFLNTGYGIELGYFTSKQEDMFINYFSFGYRMFDTKKVYESDQSGNPILSSYFKYDEYKEYVFGSYSDIRIFDKPVSPTLGLGANIVINTFKNTNYTNNIATSSTDEFNFGFLLIPRIGVAYDLSYYFSLTAGLGYILRINKIKEPVDSYLNPYLGISFFLD
jgi:hypothetical protein